MPVARFRMPDGRVGRFQVPDGTTPDQAQGLIQQHLSDNPIDENPDDGLISQISNDLSDVDKRQKSMADAVAAGDKNKYAAMAQSGLAAASIPGRALTDIGMKAGNIASDALLPGLDTVKAAGGQILQKAMNTEPVKNAVGAASQYLDQHPRVKEGAETAGDILNILGAVPAAGMAENVVKSGVKSGVKMGRDAAGSAGESLVNSAKNQADSIRKDYISAMLEPEGKKNLTQGIADGKYERPGLNKELTYTPSPREQEIANDVAKVDGVNPKNFLSDNINAMRDEISAKSEELKPVLQQKGFAKWELNNAVDDAVNEAVNVDTLTGDSATYASKVGDHVKDFIKNNPSNLNAVWEARKDLDRWLIRAKGEKIFEGDRETAQKIAARAIRNKLNAFLEQSAPDAGTKATFRYTSNLYDAIDAAAPKAAAEPASRIDAIIGKTKDLASNKAALGAAGGAVLAPHIAGPIAGAGLAGYGAYKAGQALTGPTMKEALGKALMAIGGKVAPEAAEAAVTPEAVKMLALPSPDNVTPLPNAMTPEQISIAKALMDRQSVGPDLSGGAIKPPVSQMTNLSEKLTGKDAVTMQSLSDLLRHGKTSQNQFISAAKEYLGLTESQARALAKEIKTYGGK